MKEYKVCCVGGGPAGCTTAETLKRLYPDSDVDVYERSRIGKRECGEALGKLGRELLQLPSSYVARDVEKVFVKMGHIEKLRYIPGCMINRAELNRYLIERAKSCGCNTRIKHEVMSVERKKEKWKIKVKSLKNGTEFFDTYDLLIASDGSPSIMAMYTGVVTREERKRWIRTLGCAFQFKLKTPDNYREELYFEFPPLTDQDISQIQIEYFYLFRHHGDLTNVGCVYYPQYINHSEIHLRLKEFVEKMGIKKERVVKKMGGYIPLGGPLPRTYADGVMVVGDAAGQTDPLFGGGITRAIICGKIAGEVGAKALEAGDLSGKTLKEYEKWREKLRSNLLLKTKYVSRKIRANQPVTEDELKIFSEGLDNIREYW